MKRATLKTAAPEVKMKTGTTLKLVLDCEVEDGANVWRLCIALGSKAWPITPGLVVEKEEEALVQLASVLTEMIECHLQDYAEEDEFVGPDSTTH